MARKTLQRIIWDDDLLVFKILETNEEVSAEVIEGKSFILYARRLNPVIISRTAPNEAKYFSIGEFANRKNQYLIQYYRKNN